MSFGNFHSHWKQHLLLCLSVTLFCINLSAAEKETHPPNHLAGESSPYLLMHARNPVDWYPWGPEAFEAARKENKPIFLSIGYSSCYWCHVMERLVFENEEIAAAMNENFINVKVDREERPDLDDIYMTSLLIYQQLTGSPGSGGWPMSMFLTPEGKPFAGGTYFPPEDAEDGRIGFPTVMERVVNLWKTKEASIRENADVVTRVVQRQMKPAINLESVELNSSRIQECLQALKQSYDPEFGGIDFDSARPDSPKFPTPAKLSFLLHQARQNQDDEAREMIISTLENIARGGIRDHLGGGFHRYSTDRRWLVPHFEKMLYDQAQLASLYLTAWDMTQKPLFRETAVSTLEFVLRDLTDEQGGFYSAIDAETESVEGKYYVWSKTEIREVLGEAEAEQFFVTYGLNQPNPFEHGYVLHFPKPKAEIASALKVSVPELNQKIADWQIALLNARQQREQPLLDDKILVSWNGLMIEAFALAGKMLDEPRYIEAAVKASSFIEQQMTDADGNLLRTARDGRAKLNAYLDDYAFFISSLLQLHDSTGNDQWLTKARSLMDLQIERYWDDSAKGFYFTSHDHEELIARSKNAFDAVTPSGNGISALNLLRLEELTAEVAYRQKAEEILKAFTPVYDQSPRSLSILSVAMSEFLNSEDQPTSQRIPLNVLLSPVSLQEDKKHPIKFRPYLNVKKLPPGKNAYVAIVIEIDENWHINTNPAQPDFFIPTEFKVISKDGVALKATKYPKGKPFELEGFDEPLMVYEGQVVIYGQLEIPEKLAGKQIKVQMNVKYQACNDVMCKPPATIGGTLTLSVARQGEAIEPANEKYFPKR